MKNKTHTHTHKRVRLTWERTLLETVDHREEARQLEEDLEPDEGRKPRRGCSRPEERVIEGRYPP